MLTIASAASSGPDILLVCGCKGTTFPASFPENAPTQDKPNSLLLLCHNQYFILSILLLVLYH